MLGFDGIGLYGGGVDAGGVLDIGGILFEELLGCIFFVGCFWVGVGSCGNKFKNI